MVSLSFLAGYRVGNTYYVETFCENMEKCMSHENRFLYSFSFSLAQNDRTLSSYVFIRIISSTMRVGGGANIPCGKKREYKIICEEKKVSVLYFVSEFGGIRERFHFFK